MMKMGTNKHVIGNDPVFGYVVSQAFRQFQTSTVNPIHLNDIFFEDLEIRKSSPGLPWQPQYKTRGEVMDCPKARNSIRLFWHRIKAGENVTPDDCKVLYRAHIQKDEPKIRAVYGYPTAITLMEACFALPMINEYKKGRTPIGYGYDMAVGGAYRIRRRLIPYSSFGCIDFSCFDKTVSSELITIAFQILGQNLDLRRYQDKGIPDASRLLRAWNYLVRYFIETPLRLCNGERWRKTAGVPSGSYFTQLVDSIVNWILINYAFLKRYGRMPAECIVFGDDSVVADFEGFSLSDLSTELSNVGMVVNEAKSLFTNNVDEVEFLGFTISFGLPCRSYDKWLEALFHPEWPDRDWSMFASRALGLFYANGGVNEAFSYTCRRIVGFREFEVNLPRDTERMLRNVGVNVSDCSPVLPCDLDLLFRHLRI